MGALGVGVSTTGACVGVGVGSGDSAGIAVGTGGRVAVALGAVVLVGVGFIEATGGTEGTVRVGT